MVFVYVFCLVVGGCYIGGVCRVVGDKVVFGGGRGGWVGRFGGWVWKAGVVVRRGWV